MTLLQVAATNTGALRSCIQDRKEASNLDETPAGSSHAIDYAAEAGHTSIVKLLDGK